MGFGASLEERSQKFDARNSAHAFFFSLLHQAKDVYTYGNCGTRACSPDQIKAFWTIYYDSRERNYRPKAARELLLILVLD